MHVFGRANGVFGGASPRTRRRGLVAVGAALLAVTAAVGVWHQFVREETPGQRAVESQGVRILVPAAWERNALQCGTPVRNTYVVDVETVPGCLLSPPPRVDYAEMRRTADVSVDPDAAIATTASTVSGHAVRLGGDVLPDGRTRHVVVVPDRRIVVVAVSDDPGVAKAIAGSVRVE